MLKDLLNVQEETIQSILEEFTEDERAIIVRFNKRIETELSKTIANKYVLEGLNPGGI